MVWKLLGMAGGLVAGWTLTNTGPTVLAVPAFVACLFLAVLLDERARPRPVRVREVAVSVAMIEVRRLRDYLPHPATEVAAALAAVVIGGLAVTALVGVPMHAPFSEDVWPGRGVPALVSSGLITLAVVVLAVVTFLRLIVRAPRAGVDAPTRERDEGWRRRVAATLVSCLGWTVSIPLAYFGFMLSSRISETGPGAVLLTLTMTTVAVAGLFAAGWYGVKLATAGG